MPRTKTTRVAQPPSAVLKLGSLIVMGQDCTPKETTVEELEAAADVFRIAASMVRANPSLHGKIHCDEDNEAIVEIGFENPDVEFDWENGLPSLHEVKVRTA